ncbi:hypothetical protein DMA11_05920 [Marinilabiliaceae bacterium JC017]|nr:hypothetical protein DMA11_05920 [Marinilabiliaceae bacterium JC017]
MKFIFHTFTITILLFTISSCAVSHKTLPPITCAPTDKFITNTQDSLQYGFFRDVLKLSGNKHVNRWAHHHHYQVIGMEVINTSGQFRKGYQLQFYEGDERLSPVRIAWFAKKARQRSSGASFIAFPFILIEWALKGQLDEDYEPPRDANGFEEPRDPTLAEELAAQDNKRRKQANADLTKDLTAYDFTYKTLKSGVPVYGIVIFDRKDPLRNLNVRM